MPSAPAETRRKQESAAVLESDRQPAGTSCRSVCGDSTTLVGSQPQEGQERAGAPPGARGDAPIPISSVLGVAGWRRRSAGRLLPAVPSGKLLVKGGLWGSGCKPDCCGTVQPRPTRARSYVSQMLASHGDHYFCLSTKSWQ